MAGADAAEEPARERKRDRVRRHFRRYVPVPLSVRTGDLPKRAASAAVMLGVAGIAIWRGGWLLDGLILGVVIGTFVEFVRLVRRTGVGLGGQMVAVLLGAAYVGSAGYVLVELPLSWFIVAIATVIAVDTFAYFFGRGLGGPKIAPRISPSKTWAGLLGGVIGAGIVWAGALYLLQTGAFNVIDDMHAPPLGPGEFGLDDRYHVLIPTLDLLLVAGVSGMVFAIAAQAGDFFESWLKRKAHVKDSSNLIPGHGGFFDRTDGLIPVALLTSAFYWTAFA